MSGLSSPENKEKARIDQDDLEYNITFPSVSIASDHEPVVFLLGWLGAKDRHLAKYSAIYEREGCITIRYIHISKSIYFTDPSDSKHHEEVSLKLVQLLEDYGLTEHPIFVHVFSNGGYFVYRYLSDIFHKNQVNVAGGIFDSCPGKLEYLVAVKAMLTADIMPNIFVSIAAVFTFTLFYFVTMLKHIFGFNRKAQLYQVMQQSVFHSWPHLFLYSSADVIVPPHHVEEMAEARKNAGALFVQKHDFMTSSHVLHMKKHPEVYIAKCVGFFHDCLKAYDCEDLHETDQESQKSDTEHFDPV